MAADKVLFGTYYDQKTGTFFDSFYVTNSNLKVESYRVPQTRNLDGIPMNIHEENSARNFWVQSECKWTLVVNTTD